MPSLEKLVITESTSTPIIIKADSRPLNISLKANTSAQIIAKLSASESTNCTLSLEAGASAHFYRLVTLGEQAVLNDRCQIFLANNCHLSFYDINLSEGSFSSDISVDLAESHAKIEYFGLDQLLKLANTNIRLNIQHLAPHTVSEQSVRGIYADQSQGYFMGKVIVDKLAPKSSAKQRYKALLLSNQAQAQVLPQLEINNFDISAQHGASIGQLDPNFIFYLQSRGLSLIAAKALLVKSLSADIINNIDNESIRKDISYQVDLAIDQALGLRS